MTDIEIDPDLRDEIAERIEGTNFRSVDHYVEFVLREVLERADETGRTESAGRNRDVSDQLEDLGYL